MLDVPQLIQRAFNTTRVNLKTAHQGTATSPQPTVNLDAWQILQRVFANGKMRIVSA